jgi:two-component system, sensor histidine kinase
MVISKKILDLMDSKIKIKSKEKIGTSVKFIIDFDIPRNKDITEFKKIKKIDEKKKLNERNYLKITNKLKLLIVEDNKINQVALKFMLNKINKDFEIYLADDGKKAIDIIKQNSFFDIIFTDIV